MNFVRFDPETGMLTCMGYMDVVHIQAEIDAGKPTLLLKEPAYFSLGDKRVNLETLTLEDVKEISQGGAIG